MALMLLRLDTTFQKRFALAILALVVGLLSVEAARLEISEIYRLSAMDDLENKRYDAAEESLLTALTFDSENEALHLVLGGLYYTVGLQSSPSLEMFGKSRKAYLSAIQNNPLSAMAWLGLARNEEKIHSHYPPDTITTSGNSDTSPGSEQDPEWIVNAKSYYHKTMDLDPNNVFFMLNYFSFLLRTDRGQEAGAIFKKAYETAPALVNRYYLSRRSGNRTFHQIVEKFFWEKIANNLNNVRLYYSLGNWYTVQGYYAHALAVYRKGMFVKDPETGYSSQDRKFWRNLFERNIKKVDMLMKKKRNK